ncbi:MAG: hypothetical protein CR993_00870 [Rhodobacterales bacterium]|nr:MAG: hypothetical protein CR993_00870 [Rhodobacterales bacterium]
MQTQAPSWTVVSTMNEPLALMLTFAAWHLDQGASAIEIYLDRNDPPAADALRALPSVRVTHCDDAYWQASALKRRPARHTARQMHNARQSYARLKSDWLLHIDADEFVRDGAALTQAMANARPETTYIQLGVLERVFTENDGTQIFDGTFRHYSPDFEQWKDTVYGRFAKFLQHGLSGHSAGKAAVRRGLDLRINLHHPTLEDGSAPDAFERLPKMLCHFDGLTELHLILKLVRRLYLPKIKGNPNPHGKNRGAQMRFANNHKERSRELQRLVDGIQRLDAVQRAQLTALGALTEYRFDPRPALARFDLAPDLSAKAFDTELRQRDAELIAKAGLKN